MIINCKDCGSEIDVDFSLGVRTLNCGDIGEDNYESISWNCTKCFRAYEYRIKEPINITEQINKELHK